MLNKYFLQYFVANKMPLKLSGKRLINNSSRFQVRSGIPRFTPDSSYSSGNFSRLREEHSTLQLDSINNTSDRYNTLLNRTQWPKDFFKGKTILECGCGAGPDTEILLNLGAKVLAVDIAGLEVAQRNLKNNPNYKNLQLVQDSIFKLHLKPKSFDIVFCHRVLQHTPNPEETLEHLLQFVKKDGHVFVHSYSNSRFQKWRWKYALLPITNKLPSELLYGIIKFFAWPAFYITNLTNRFWVGERFNHIFVPFLNYRGSKKFRNKPDSFIVEYGIHDTFDALSPRYDSPLSPDRMEIVAKRNLTRPFEVYTDSGITLLRTKI